MKVDGLMPTIIFGPVESRRYGRSLGVNLLPGAFKLCSFDCPYCECGRTDRAASRSPSADVFPPAAMIVAALERALTVAANQRDRPIEAITLAGNGEPTLHPDFAELMRDMTDVRDRLAPSARFIALTNGSLLSSETVREGLMLADERIVKFDAADDSTLQAMNTPVCRLSVAEQIENLRRLPTEIIQTMFIRGPRVDNATDAHVDRWLTILTDIRPHAVQIYSIDRRPAEQDIEAVAPERLTEIGRRVMEEAGLPALVY